MFPTTIHKNSHIQKQAYWGFSLYISSSLHGLQVDCIPIDMERPSVSLYQFQLRQPSDRYLSKFLNPFISFNAIARLQVL